MIQGSLAAAADSTPPVTGARQRSETVGRYEWREWWWTDGVGGARRQRMTATTSEGGMTALVRDAMVPLMTTLDLGRPSPVR